MRNRVAALGLLYHLDRACDAGLDLRLISGIIGIERAPAGREGEIRTYYADLSPTLIDAIEAAYADLQELVHLVDTGPAGEHKKWAARGTEVHASMEDSMRELRGEVSKLGAELTAPPQLRDLANHGPGRVGNCDVSSRRHDGT